MRERLEQETSHCANCHRPMVMTKAWKRFCSTACRVQHQYKEMRQALELVREQKRAS
jgi:hypothetical protein